MRSPQDVTPATSASYRLSFLDPDFLQRADLRPVRLQLELLKPELAMREHHIDSTIVVFGSARTKDRASAASELATARTALQEQPDHPALLARVRQAEHEVDRSVYYEQARQFAATVSACCQNDRCECVMMTGGGPGIMEAINRGAADVGKKSIGLNIDLPGEQEPNSYITPDLSFRFRYFALRKMHFLLRACAVVIFPGGFGTLDELFEVLTLIQTGKLPRIPVVLFGRKHWKRLIAFDELVTQGYVSRADLDLVLWADDADEAWRLIRTFPRTSRDD